MRSRGQRNAYPQRDRRRPRGADAEAQNGTHVDPLAFGFTGRITIQNDL
jgi:hypothetical protein